MPFVSIELPKKKIDLSSLSFEDCILDPRKNYRREIIRRILDMIKKLIFGQPYLCIEIIPVFGNSLNKEQQEKVRQKYLEILKRNHPEVRDFIKQFKKEKGSS